MKHTCQNCGDTIDAPGNNESFECVVCGGEVVPEDKSDVVPKDELRELVEEWRGVGVSFKRAGADGKAEGLVEFAEELEALINDE